MPNERQLAARWYSEAAIRLARASDNERKQQERIAAGAASATYQNNASDLSAILHAENAEAHRAPCDFCGGEPLAEAEHTRHRSTPTTCLTTTRKRRRHSNEHDA
jgi:hypothetical protein